MNRGVVFPFDGVVINEEMIFHGSSNGICNGDNRVIVVETIIIPVQP